MVKRQNELDVVAVLHGCRVAGLLGGHEVVHGFHVVDKHEDAAGKYEQHNDEPS